jgi:regulator of nucleoside diphosphate kinase
MGGAKPASFSGDEAVTKRPNILVSSTDMERLERLLESLPNGAVPGKADLEAELDRAEVVDPKDIPPSVVTMNSTVKFKVESSQEEFCLTLVYPKDVDASGGTISILAPVGSALLGLSEGDEIEWPRPGGGTLQVRIEEIVHQPERAGEYHR